MPKSLRHKASKPHLWCSLRSASQAMTSKQHGINVASLQALVEGLVHSIAAREPYFSLSVAEEEFQCSDCQGILYRPTTGLCGRSFCMTCARKDEVECKHCKEKHKASALSMLNITLETIVETWYKEEYFFCKLLSEGDQLLEKRSYPAAEQKFTEALDKKPFHNYASVKRSLSRICQGQQDLALTDIISVKMRRLCSVMRDGDCSRDHAESLMEEEFSISKKIAKVVSVTSLSWNTSIYNCHDITNNKPILTFSEVLKMFQKNSSTFDTNADFQSYSSVMHSHALVSHKLHAVKPAQSTTKDSKTSFLLECESALDAVISEELSSQNWKSKFSELFKSLSRRSLSEIDFANNFDEDDYSCVLCTRPFYDPVCTPCGHTFCLECLERCFDHGQVCPMCKTTLTDIYRYQKFLLSVDWSVESFMKHFLPNLCKERENLREEETNRLKEKIPVFVCTVAYPKIKTMLHVFEPRYRLMIRRAIKYHGGTFGITIGSSTSPFHNIGTLITLEKVSFFADGRSLITAVGSSRFQVEEYGTCDGYATAKINAVIDDENVDQEKQGQLLSISNEVYEKSKAWFDSSSDHFKHTTSVMFGDFPAQDGIEGPDGPMWAWWVTAILPVKDDVKTLILGKKCLRTRLHIMNLILNRIRDS